MRPAALIGPVLLSLVAAPAARTGPRAVWDVLVVDADGGGDHLRIADALAAAADGDVLLVRPGTYGNEGTLALGTKSVSIVADGGGSVSVTGKFEVDLLPAGKRVVLRGLDVANGAFSRCLEATDCLGLVWLEDCSFTGFAASLFDSPDPVVLSDCAAVVLRDCESLGGTGVNGLSGGSGLRAARSTVHLEGCLLMGGVGAKDPMTLAGDVGGAGLTLEDGVLVAADGSFTGGKGGDGGSFGLCADSGDGGVGIHLTGSDPAATLRGVVLAGGEPGDVVGAGSCTSGLQGAQCRVDAGTLAEHAWPTFAMDVASPVRTDELALTSFSGPPGASAWIGLSDTPGLLLLPTLHGSLYLTPTIAVGFEGVLDAGGTLTTKRPVSLAGALEADVAYLQALFFDPATGSFTLASPSALVVLDPAF